MADFDVLRVTWVLDRKALDHLVAAIEFATEISFDLETSGLDEHATRGGPTNGGVAALIALASFTIPQPDDPPETATTWLVPLAHPESPWLGQWRSVLKLVSLEMVAAGHPVMAHHGKFDCRWAYAHTGVDISELLRWDSLVSSSLLDENASTKLKNRAPATFGVPPWDEFDLSRPGAALAVPLVDLGLYAARDTYWTWRLARAHRHELVEDWADEAPMSSEDVTTARLGNLATWCAMPTVSALAAIEQRGIVLDRDWVADRLTWCDGTVAGLSEVLAEKYDMDPAAASFAPTSHWFRDWTGRAIEAGDLRIAAMTPSGNPQWTKGVLIRQARNGSGVAQQVLDLRGASKQAEFLRSWLYHATPEGLIHTTYNVGRVITGRTSSEHPNMQQVTASLKPAFVPRDGYLFADLDYSQIELRVAAHIAHCLPMIIALKAGRDLHAMIAAQITGKPITAITPDERHGGKAANFGFLFGQSPYGFREYAEAVYDVSFTMEQAEGMYRAFFDTWDGMAQWHARVVATAQRTGQVTSPIGRIRRLPDIWDGNDALAARAARNAINSPVQGFASDLMQIAAASITGRLPGHDRVDGAFIVATVHDSILVEVQASRWIEVTRACRDRMVGAQLEATLARMGCVLDVPLAASATVGSRWGLSDVGVVA